ncbi:MAG: hypothetical protein KDE31_06600, partial [Caldilineaceae bacterium]|nr:hypothetical protein [Caldilineaceae bacterium]
ENRQSPVMHWSAIASVKTEDSLSIYSWLLHPIFARCGEHSNKKARDKLVKTDCGIAVSKA